MNLYSRDFYRLALERLEPGGLFAQWLPIATQNDEDTRSLVRSFLDVFPYATLFYVLAYNPVSGGVSGWGWIFVVLGFVFDIGHWVGGGVTGRQRYASA